MDSLAVANWLDEKYPGPLYNDETKSHDLELLDHFQGAYTMTLISNLSPYQETIL